MTWAYFSVSAVDRKPSLVLGHRDDPQVPRRSLSARARAIECVERHIGERVGELASPVRAEVQVDDRLAIVELAVDAVDDRRLHELVSFAVGVGLLDGRRRAGSMLPHPEDDRVVGQLDPIPTLVAIHPEIAPADGRDPDVGMDVGQPPLQIRDELDRRARRRVAPVKERVHAHASHALPIGQLGESHEVSVVGVDATRPDQPDDVEPA